MQHTTAAAVIAVANAAAGAGLAAVAMITATAVAPAFILAFVFAMVGGVAAVGIVERGRDGYVPRRADANRQAVPEPA